MTDIVQLGAGTYQLETGPADRSPARVTLRGDERPAHRRSSTPHDASRVVEIANASAVDRPPDAQRRRRRRPVRTTSAATLTANTSTVLLDHVRVTDGHGLQRRRDRQPQRLDDDPEQPDRPQPGAPGRRGRRRRSSTSAATAAPRRRWSSRDSTIAFNTAQPRRAGSSVAGNDRGHARARERDAGVQQRERASAASTCRPPTAARFTTRGEHHSPSNLASSGGANCDAPAM